MSARLSPVRAVCACLLSVSLATPTAAWAGPAEDEDAKTLYAKASAKYSAADYAGAIEYFTAALEKATAENLPYRVRGALLFNLAKAHVKAFEELDGDVTHLRSARSIYRRYLDEAPASDGQYGDVSEAKSELARVETMLEEEEKKLAAQPQGGGGSLDADAIRRQALLAAERERLLEKSQRHLIGGIVLTIGGSMSFLSGAGFLGWGSTFKRFAEEEIIADRPTEEKDLPFDDDEQAYYDGQARNGKIWMGVGGGLMAVGGGLLGVGIWQIMVSKKIKKQEPQISLMPVMTRDQMGMNFGMRF